MDVAYALRNEDLLQNILSRLPTIHFASATRVSKFCNLILYQRKLETSLSLSSSLQFVVQEVLDEILSDPIRPHFTIAYIGTSAVDGMIGIVARTGKVKEASVLFMHSIREASVSSMRAAYME
ncbi:hypothetical protein Ddye_017960 [Dipteronia dyeriana]|uniref:F-box domain-containing protein n=1 Tax=Dipteronia dyeriana TaxID=168575 RepID=A0AAD9U9P6_9ROSI|nr:hypothetical protein Ddye_017960 [Dipteronia dyeriana]